MAPLWAFVRLSRPHFLVGGWLMFAVGAATADGIDAVGYTLGQVMVTAAQLTAHYVNEYADVEADRSVKNRTFFSGGSGVLPAGKLHRSVALQAAWTTTAVTVAGSAALATQSLPAAVIGLVALLISWTYSMPPVRLVATGWGEMATSLLVAGAVPMVGLLSQGSDPMESLWWSIAILVPIHFAMMLAFELPDLESDATAGKKVLAVRIGRGPTTAAVFVLLGSSLVVAAAAGSMDALPVAVAWWTGAAIVPTAVITAMKGQPQWLTTSAVATLVFAAVGLLISLA